jgi:hypothetical protein
MEIQDMKAEFKAQELTKVASFINSINNLICGKFILADVKINEVLNKIEASDELYYFIKEQLIDFNFEKELRKAEIKNRFNGGVFKLPESESKAIALVFCLLVEFNTKNLDFYDFVKENFPTTDNKGDQNAFAEVVLAPLRNSVAKYFGLSKQDNEAVIKELESKVQEEKLQEQMQAEQQQEEKSQEDMFFENVEKIQKHLLEIIKTDPKIKQSLKEDLTFILKSMIYANQYKDLKILNALIVSFERLTKKVHSIRFVYDELKELILDYYNKNAQVNG